MDEREELDFAEDRYYELGFLVKSENTESVKKVLQANKAAVYEEGGLTKILLSYPIKKEKMGFFAYCRFTALPEAAAAINESLKFEPEVLRAILIKLPANTLTKTAKAASAEGKKVLRRREAEPRKEGGETGLTNEDLEKKIEEIIAD